MSETPAATPDQPKQGFRHVRLVVALVVASLLGTFAVYTAFADSSIPVLMVAQAQAYEGQHVRLEGKVTQSTGDAADPSGLRFTVKDYKSAETLSVIYTGAVPDAYKVGRDVVIDGTLKDGVFTAVPDTLVTKCPSKYSDKATTSDTKS
ncbi:MAG: cytochrome c maturation protein CcmE [Thermoleophilia bacterium]